MPENQPNTNIHKKSAVLITGGSGVIGIYLTSSLLSERYEVSHLSRSANQFAKVSVFRRDPENGFIDTEIFEGINYIIHLAGANTGDWRWTKERKEDAADLFKDMGVCTVKTLTG